MNILVCGSSGCVGRAVTQALRWRGHHVVETSRHVAATNAVGSHGSGAMALDFTQEVSSAAWAERLSEARIDAVVNCVGILVPSGANSFERTHTEGPLALFRGAAAAGVGRVVQVSALGVGAPSAGETEPPYLRSKRLADEALLGLDIDAAVVRPSLVYGPGSQSGAMFATLASLPVIALPGRGEQRVQPIHVFELAESIVALLERTGQACGIYELGGGAVLGYRDMLAAYRRAQGLGEAIWLPMPMLAMRSTARVAEWLPQRVLSRDTIRMLARGSVTVRNAAPVLLGRAPASLEEGLAVSTPVPAFSLRVVLPAPVESAMRIALGALWVYIALISAALPERSGATALLAQCGFGGDLGEAVLALSCAFNLGIGLLTIARPGVRIYALQAAAIVGYTLVAAVGMPSLTLDHCGPLAKNVPLLMFVVALWLAQAGRAAVPRPMPALTRRYSPPEARWSR